MLPIEIVYGIAITAMSFFTDPTIATLTSGSLSQNTDLGGLSFPRRMGVRFNADYISLYKLLGSRAVWTAYNDPQFTEDLGKDFVHEDTIVREGWARYYFKGIFPKQTAYLKLEISNTQTGMLLKTFYFKFTKSYQTSLSGDRRIKDPVTGEKIIKNGVLVELVEKRLSDGSVKYIPGNMTFKDQKLNIGSLSMSELVTAGEETIKPVDTETNAVLQTSVRYTEKPKAVFLVTPPHMMKYAKIILILVGQLVDMNFDKSYMTKANQKPLYKTRFMLDELGNLQSEGHGIDRFETMLSIGLGQEQQFTLILQTLQQLRAVNSQLAL